MRIKQKVTVADCKSYRVYKCELNNNAFNMMMRRRESPSYIPIPNFIILQTSLDKDCHNMLFLNAEGFLASEIEELLKWDDSRNPIIDVVFRKSDLRRSECRKCYFLDLNKCKFRFY